MSSLSEEKVVDYVRMSIPLIGDQTRLERAYAEKLHVEGMLSMAFYAQLIEIDTRRMLQKEIAKEYKKQVDRFEVSV